MRVEILPASNDGENLLLRVTREGIDHCPEQPIRREVSEAISYPSLDDSAFRQLVTKFALSDEKILDLANGLERAASLFATRSRINAKPTDRSMARDFGKLKKQIERIADFGANRNFRFFKSAIDRAPPKSTPGLSERNQKVWGSEMETFGAWIMRSGDILTLVQLAEEKQNAWADLIENEGGNSRIKMDIPPKEYLFAVRLPKLYTQITGNLYLIEQDKRDREATENEGTRFLQLAARTLKMDEPKFGTIVKHHFNYIKKNSS